MANTQDKLREHFKDVSDTFMSLIISGVPIGGLFGGLSAGIIAGMCGMGHAFKSVIRDSTH